MVASRTPGKFALTPNDEAPAAALHEGLFRSHVQLELEHRSIVRARQEAGLGFLPVATPADVRAVRDETPT